MFAFALMTTAIAMPRTGPSEEEDDVRHHSELKGFLDFSRIMLWTQCDRFSEYG
jgi:hypothetical protein